MLNTVTDNRARVVVHNGALNVLEYAMQPALMLISAPILLRKWGVAQYGIWMLLSATITAGSNLYAGVADATVKYVASGRESANPDGISRVLRAAMFIHLAVGGFLALVLWISAPTLVNAIHLNESLSAAAVLSFRIATPLLFLRSAESVLLASLRGFERYAPAVMASVAIRTASTTTLIATALLGYGIPGATTATLAISTLGIAAEFVIVRRTIGPLSTTQPVTIRDVSELVAFGSFGALQALSGVFFNQADRWAIGVVLGAPAVAYYSICVQIAQPVHGLIAAGFNAIFPHLSARFCTTSALKARRMLSRSFNLNMCLALLGVPLAALVGKLTLPVLVGSASVQHAWPCLLILVVAFALLAGNITGHFTLLALGDARYVCLINIAASVSAFVLLLILSPRFGLSGAAMARLIYGPITWLVYARIRHWLRRLNETDDAQPTLALSPGAISRFDEVAP